MALDLLGGVNAPKLGEAFVELLDRDIFFRLASTDEGVVECTRLKHFHTE